ncbi:hypothetical protein IKQ21_05900 [bacterium]|nr:hypothetical protein [bacterium]
MKRLVTALIFTLLASSAAFADFDSETYAEFTGESFFTPPAVQDEKENVNKKHKHNATMPPLKKARIMIKNKCYDRAQKNSQLAPVSPEETIYNQDNSTSEFASKEQVENFDENMMPDGFEADEQSIQDNRKTKFFRGKNNKNTTAQPEDNENIIMDCDNMDYDTDKYCLYARGNVNVEFVKQGTVVKADLITYDRMNNTIKAEGNVQILKNGQTITGDYIFVDMNEENALIENPVAEMATVEIKAKKGYVYGDKIVEENGSILIDKEFPIEFASQSKGPQMDRVMYPKKQRLETDVKNGLVKIEVKEIKITQKGDLETLRVKSMKLKKGKYTLLKLPALKVYTNKNNDYIETNSWEIGSRRGLGMYVGPGFVFELPKGSVLKAIPMLNYKNRFGVGGVTRFSSGTNLTQAAYGTAEGKFVVQGKQRLDDNLFLQYAVNDYMDEWFLGRRRPKYGVDLVYRKSYSSDNFLLKGHVSRFTHNADFGYFQNIDKDRHFKNLRGGHIGTTRARYMMEASQNFLDYKNEDKLQEFSLALVGQLSSALYGTGDTQFVARIGPRLHTQYKRWAQDVGYFQSVYADDTPMPVYDAYRYGKSNLYAREYFRINRYITLCWFVSLCLSNDSPNNRQFQENAFYISVGPDDFKFNLGYDLIRENTYFVFQMMMDAKGTQIDYDKLEIKQDKKAKHEEKLVDKSEQNVFKNSEKAPVLERAEVENISTVEDVL